MLKKICIGDSLIDNEKEDQPSLLEDVEELPYAGEQRPYKAEISSHTIEHIHRLAFYDHLTGVANRMLLMDRLGLALSHAHRHKRSVILLFLDLDGFKAINDSLGHAAGDQVLWEVARCLETCVRESDTVARIGGDEFILCVPDVDRDPVAAARLGKKLASKLRERMATGIRIDDHHIVVNFSVGIAVYPWDGKDAITLIKNADAAMYHAKRQSRNGLALSATMNSTGQKRWEIQQAIKQVFEQGDLELHYQPQLDFHSGRIVGVEALLRLRRGIGSGIPLDDFLLMADESNFIQQIGDWVLTSVCAQQKAWAADGYFGDGGMESISVNISARQITQPDFIERVASILREAALDASWLELEVTEESFLHGTEKALATFESLRQMGIGIAINDFGKTCSVLASLKKFPLTKFKVTPALIQNITTDPKDEALLRAITILAKGLKLKVIAVGVETVEQVDFLREIGCDGYQGYYLNRPLPAVDFYRFYKSRMETYS